eukprot:1161090-Pelagomonas_calceolata.AAC.9
MMTAERLEFQTFNSEQRWSFCASLCGQCRQLHPHPGGTCGEESHLVRQSKAVATLPLACLAGQPGVGVSVDCVDDDGNGMDLCVHAITAQTELLEQPGQLPIRGTPAIWTARRRVVALVGPLLFVP